MADMPPCGLKVYIIFSQLFLFKKLKRFSVMNIYRQVKKKGQIKLAQNFIGVYRDIKWILYNKSFLNQTIKKKTSPTFLYISFKSNNSLSI